MSDVIINEQSLIDIADAIRDKLGVETEYKPSEMAGAIEEIEAGVYGTKNIDANGIYNASDDGYTGYDKVVVNVPQEGGDMVFESEASELTDYPHGNFITEYEFDLTFETKAEEQV